MDPVEGYNAYIVRHGETDWNVQRRLQSHADIPLNKKGQQQASQLARQLKDVAFFRAYTSDLQRAVSTAEIILEGRDAIALIKTTELREAYVGPWEGKPLEAFLSWKAAHRPPNELSREQWLEYKYHPAIESYAQIYRRLLSFLSKLQLPKGCSILVCAHGGILSALMQYLDARSRAHWHVSNGALIELKVVPSGLQLLSLEGISLGEPEEESQGPIR